MQTILAEINSETFSPPQVIILYGPPASGKGTQANMLFKHLSKYNYNHLDFGQLLREYVLAKIGTKENIEANYPSIRLEAEKNIEKHTAIVIYETMKKGEAIDSSLMWRVAEEKVIEIIKKGENLIIDGLGRTIGDCYKFAEICNLNKFSVALFHICLSENMVIQRSVSRWYAPSSKISFPTFFAAQQFCIDSGNENEKPYQRVDDTNVAKIRQRYKNLYEDIYAKILSTLQIECLAELFIIDGSDTVDDTFKRIAFYLNKYYNSKNKLIK